MPKKMQHHKPEKVDPVVEKNRKSRSANRDKRGIQRMANPTVGASRA
jgi:hypothetical protein